MQERSVADCRVVRDDDDCGKLCSPESTILGECGLLVFCIWKVMF